VTLPSLHDNLLVSYTIDSEGRTIRLRARRPSWPDPSDQDRFVVFGGVEGYALENDAFGNIILSLDPIPLDELLLRFGSAIRESYRLSGAPGGWAADLDTAREVLASRAVQGFLLNSSYGLSGWVLARDVTIERDTPLRSEIVRCVLPLIHDWQGGLGVLALVGDVIAADSRRNVWFANQKRKDSELSDESWLKMLERNQSIRIQLKVAVERFSRGGKREELLAALREAVAKLNQDPDFGLR
jgi:hypothetical protein